MFVKHMFVRSPKLNILLDRKNLLNNACSFVRRLSSMAARHEYDIQIKHLTLAGLLGGGRSASPQRFFAYITQRGIKVIQPNFETFLENT